MSKPVDFRYTRIGDTCLIDQKMMDRLYRFLRRNGIDIKDNPPKNNPNPHRRGKIKHSLCKDHRI
jgi:hypothetical protein